MERENVKIRYLSTINTACRKYLADRGNTNLGRNIARIGRINFQLDKMSPLIWWIRAEPFENLLWWNFKLPI